MKKSRYQSFNAFLEEEREALEIKKRVKSEEEITRYSTVQDLDETQRLAVLLDSNEDAQKLSALHNAVVELEQCNEEKKNLLLSKMSRVILRGHLSLQQEAGSIYLHIIERIQNLDVVEQRLLKLVLKMMESDECIVASTWLLCLEKMISLLPNQYVIEEALAFAIDKSNVVQAKHHRAMSCSLLGLCAKHMQGSTIEERILDMIVLLCQDTESEIRARICLQIETISRRIDTKKAEQTIFIELEELLRDEEASVIIEAMKCFVAIFDILPYTDILNTYLPAFMRNCSSKRRLLQMVSAELIGKLVDIIARDKRASWNDTLSLIYERYKVLADDKDTEIRRLCAFNFPAMQKSMGKSVQMGSILSSFIKLAGDSEVSVRICIAACLHEVLLMSVKERVTPALRQVFFALLTDASMIVKRHIVEHIEVSAALILDAEDQSRSNEVQERVLVSLLEYQCSLLLCWRFRQHFLIKLKQLCNVFSPEIIDRIFSLQIVKDMKQQPVPVQISCGEFASYLLRKHPRWTRRIELTQILLSEFGHSDNYRHRILFVHCCSFLLNDFSRKWFKDRVLETCFTLSADDVPNVRQKLCLFLPVLQQRLAFEPGSYHDTLLENALKKLNEDDDLDVKQAAQDVLININLFKTHQCDKSGALMLDENEERVDRAKENAEESVLADSSKFSPDFFRAQSTANTNELHALLLHDSCTEAELGSVATTARYSTPAFAASSSSSSSSSSGYTTTSNVLHAKHSTRIAPAIVMSSQTKTKRRAKTGSKKHVVQPLAISCKQRNAPMSSVSRSTISNANTTISSSSSSSVGGGGTKPRIHTANILCSSDKTQRVITNSKHRK